MKMPMTLPRPPSSAIPPIRQAVAAESSKVSKPSGVALPRRTDKSVPPSPASVPDKAKAMTSGRISETPAARASSAAAADGVDLTAPDRVAEEKADQDEHDEHVMLSGERMPRTRVLMKSTSPSRSIGTVTVFSLLMMRARPRNPMSVPIVKTSELIPVAAMIRPWIAPNAAGNDHSDHHRRQDTDAGDNQIDGEHTDDRCQRPYRKIEFAGNHGDADADRNQADEHGAVEKRRDASHRVIGRQQTGKDRVDDDHERGADREVDDRLSPVHARLR